MLSKNTQKSVESTESYKTKHLKKTPNKQLKEMFEME